MLRSAKEDLFGGIFNGSPKNLARDSKTSTKWTLLAVKLEAKAIMPGSAVK
jgi:hypothetical protein